MTLYETYKFKQFKNISKIADKHSNQNLVIELTQTTYEEYEKYKNKYTQKIKTDCKSGCSYCCHQPVTLFAFEAINIANILKLNLKNSELKLLISKMKKRLSEFKNNSVRENINNKTVCPLLENNICSVYENRPLTCRMAHSFSVKKCKSSFENNRAKVMIPVSLELGMPLSGMIEGTFESLPKYNLDGNLYELCSAILYALTNEKDSLLWSKGSQGFNDNCIIDDT